MVNKRNENDDLLVDGLLRGDSHAFERIYHKYVKDLYLIAMGYLNNDPEAQDVVQEVFIYLWNNRLTLKPNLKLGAYLRKMVKNASLNSIRNRRIKEKHQNVLLTHNRGSIEIDENEEVYKEQSKSFDSKLMLVRDRLEQLPKGCKKAFVMSVIEGHTYKEVSKKMGISVNTVKTQIKIAYQRIRG
nr:RNA polymerase sigma-70 factor [uncultured Draconibacterium sp.]